MKQNYITAVLQKLQAGSDPEVVISGLKNTLRKHGHDALFGVILNGVVRVLEAASAESTTVTVVNKRSFEDQKTEIEAALTDLKTTGNPTVVTDETIIGGFIVEANNVRLDKSYKTKLVSLYRSLTN